MHDGVEEHRERLGMRRGGAAGDDQRIVLAAIGALERDAAEVEHREDVRVRELELEREADDVEVLERTRALERDERQLARAELLLHVDPRRVAALGERARIVVQDLVEDLEAEMAHPDVVDVGEREADARLHGAPSPCGRRRTRRRGSGRASRRDGRTPRTDEAASAALPMTRP